MWLWLSGGWSALLIRTTTHLNDDKPSVLEYDWKVIKAFGHWARWETMAVERTKAKWRVVNTGQTLICRWFWFFFKEGEILVSQWYDSLNKQTESPTVLAQHIYFSLSITSSFHNLYLLVFVFVCASLYHCKTKQAGGRTHVWQLSISFTPQATTVIVHLVMQSCLLL